MTIVPTSECVLRGIANSAVTAGLDLAQQLGVDLWLTEDHIHFCGWRRFGRRNSVRLTPPSTESVALSPPILSFFTTSGSRINLDGFLAPTYGRNNRRGG